MLFRLILFLLLPVTLHAQSHLIKTEVQRLHLKNIRTYQQFGKQEVLYCDSYYDTLGRLTLELRQTPYKDQVRKQLTAYTYDQKGYIITELRQMLDTIRDSTVYAYPDTGREFTATIYRNGRLHAVKKENYGNRISQWEMKSASGITRNIQQTDSIRDSSKCSTGIVRQDIYDHNNRQYIMETTETTTDCKGVSKTVSRHGDRQEPERTEMVMSPDRKMTESTKYDHKGKLKWRTITRYDEAGRMCSSTTYGRNNKETGRSNILYDDQGKILQVRSYASHGRPRSETRYSYYENGLQKEIRTTSKQKDREMHVWWEYAYYSN